MGKKRKLPGLNTSSTADISFILLIFFLITTQMVTDKGLTRRLPPPPKTEEDKIDVKDRDLMHVMMNARDEIRVKVGSGEGFTTVAVKDLKEQAKRFIKNDSNDPHLPEKHPMQIDGLGMCAVTMKHVISVQCDRGSSYKAYFEIQNELVAAYNEIRDELAKSRFSKLYEDCSDEQKATIRQYYPQKISEAEPKDRTKN